MKITTSGNYFTVCDSRGEFLYSGERSQVVAWLLARLLTREEISRMFKGVPR